MNWKLTRPGLEVTFKKDEPIAMLVPSRRGELESFQPIITALQTGSRTAISYNNWRRGREQFLEDLKEPLTSGGPKWQGDYFRGVLGSPPSGVGKHQMRLHLRPFQPGEQG
jgi:hypothetical protein